jgi:hypothetical protein
MNVPLRECGEEDLYAADSVLKVQGCTRRIKQQRLAKPREAGRKERRRGWRVTDCAEELITETRRGGS